MTRVNNLLGQVAGSPYPLSQIEPPLIEPCNEVEFNDDCKFNAKELVSPPTEFILTLIRYDPA